MNCDISTKQETELLSFDSLSPTFNEVGPLVSPISFLCVLHTHSETFSCLKMAHNVLKAQKKTLKPTLMPKKALKIKFFICLMIMNI